MRAEIFAKKTRHFHTKSKKNRSSYHSLTITMKPYHSLSYYIGKHNPYLNEFLIPYTETIYIGKTW